MRLITISLIIIFLCASVITACDETVNIGDSTYTVDSIWCGKKMDTLLTPVYEDLQKLPDTFTFKDAEIYIRSEACSAFVEMANAALKDSVLLIVQSGYRSPGYQAQLVKKRMIKGKSFGEVIRYVAPPGYSEHQTGYAIDLKSPGSLFSQSIPYAWLKKHAGEYGFVEQYPKDNKTLKSYEPWHWTYLGHDSKLADK